MTSAVIDSNNVHLVVDAFCSTFLKRFGNRSGPLSQTEYALIMEWLMKATVAYAKINQWELSGLHEGFDLLWKEADEYLEVVNVQ